MTKTNKKKYNDSGVTIANMNVEGMPWYRSEKEQTKKEALKALQITRQERRAIIKGAFLAFIPTFLIIIGSFVVVFLLIYFFLLK